jgi:uncharacterized protein
LSFPGREEALEILRDAGCSQGVVSHCLNVANLSTKLGLKLLEAGYELDLYLVEVGALLHDLGRSVTHSIQHGVVGADIARKRGLPIEIVRIIERHIGAGIPSDEANELGFPEGVYIPETLEEKLVTYADKLAEGAGEVDFMVTVERMVKELGSDHPAIQRMLVLHEEIQGMLRTD